MGRGLFKERTNNLPFHIAVLPERVTWFQCQAVYPATSAEASCWISTFLCTQPWVAPPPVVLAFFLSHFSSLCVCSADTHVELKGRHVHEALRVRSSSWLFQRGFCHYTRSQLFGPLLPHGALPRSPLCACVRAERPVGLNGRKQHRQPARSVWNALRCRTSEQSRLQDCPGKLD